MIKTAVILAAGHGRRLNLHRKPKGFVNIIDKPLIEYSIRALLAHGIERIVIGTGFKYEHYDRLKTRFPQIITKRNEDFAKSGSLVTFCNLGEHLDEDFLLLESDLLYDAHCLKTLLSDTHENAVLLSDADREDDAVFVEANQDKQLVRISKEPRHLVSKEEGVLVGITKMSIRTYNELLAVSDSVLERNYLEHYDFAFQCLQSKFFVLKIDHLLFTEIDDDSQLQYALNVVYPKLDLSYS
jgi:2-aminoethylphosphonate-pyruvate transaminase